MHWLQLHHEVDCKHPPVLFLVTLPQFYHPPPRASSAGKLEASGLQNLLITPRSPRRSEAIRAPGTSGMWLAVADRRLSGDTTKLYPPVTVNAGAHDHFRSVHIHGTPIRPLKVTSRCCCCKSVAMRRASYSRGEIDTRSCAHDAYAAADTVDKIEHYFFQPLNITRKLLL
jgi:hypothetical protein